MSFIYNDNKLINELIKSALEFDQKFSKKGQAALDPAYNQQNNNFANLHQLINDLEQKINTQNSEPEVSHEGDPDTEISLRSENLESLGALVSFLASSKITINSQRIAYHLNEDPKNENYQLYQLEPNAGLLEVEDRSKVTQGFFVNKDLLVTYLMSLQAAQEKKPNAVLKIMLSKLIQEANELLDTNISQEYKSKQPNQPNQPSQQGQQGQQIYTQQSAVNALHLAQKTVFHPDYIDFELFRNFLNSYKQLHPEDASTNSQAFEAERSMQMASADTASNLDRFPMNNISYQEMLEIAGAPQQQKIIPLLQGLKGAVRAVGYVYARFYEKDGPGIRVQGAAGSAAFDNMDSQIMGSGSAYQMNLGDLMRITQYATQQK